MNEDYYAAKTDKGKPRMDLIPAEWFTGLAQVLTIGAEKYGAESWRTVPDAQIRYKAALMRHYTAAHAGQTVSDDGLNPWLQVAVNALFLYSLVKVKVRGLPCELCTYRYKENNPPYGCHNPCEAFKKWKGGDAMK